MKTINLRSTAALTKYVTLTDRMATLTKQLKELETEEKNTRAEVLEEIGERKEIAVRGQVRILIPKIKESIGQVDTDNTVIVFKQIGLPVETRSPEFVAPATFKALVLKGIVPEELVKRSEEITIVVT